MTDTVLVLAWLILAHLVADFVLQNDWIAINKGQGGRRGWRALSVHGFHVGLCLVPVVPGVRAARRRLPRRRRGLARARGPLEGQGDPPGGAGGPGDGAPADGRDRRGPRVGAGQRLDARGPGCCSSPTRSSTSRSRSSGWLVLLEGVALQPVFVDAGQPRPAHAGTGRRSTPWSSRASCSSRCSSSTRAPRTTSCWRSCRRATSRRPGAASRARRRARPRPRPRRPATPSASDRSSRPSSPAWPAPVPAATGRARPDARPSRRSTGPRPPRSGAPPGSSVPSGAPARIGATIGALERLLIVVFVLVGAEAAVGLRHRRQDHRPLQAARRPRVRRVLPARHARERLGGDRHARSSRRPRWARFPDRPTPGCAGSARATRGRRTARRRGARPAPRGRRTPRRRTRSSPGRGCPPRTRTPDQR